MLYLHPERSEGYRSRFPDEMLHCVQHDVREICELNYDAMYNYLSSNIRCLEGGFKSALQVEGMKVGVIAFISTA